MALSSQSPQNLYFVAKSCPTNDWSSRAKVHGFVTCHMCKVAKFNYLSHLSCCRAAMTPWLTHTIWLRYVGLNLKIFQFSLSF